ncbi:MAG: FAD-dependent oxidoreductase, partial [Oscillospiraceae bacterium]
MFTKEMIDSVKKVEATRADRMGVEPRRMTAKEKEDLLKEFHPDYKEQEFDTLTIGPNKGEKVPKELRNLLEANSRISTTNINLENIEFDTDVLIIGGGGAGASAAIEANNGGADVTIVTKLRMGDANTMMAEGGIQAADKANDSPATHYIDAMGGGHFANKPELLSKLVCEAPDAIKWLNNLGVMFDKEDDGTMVTTHGGGTSRKRMHAAADYSGAEIMRVLRDEVMNRGIKIVDFTAAIELILDEDGKAAGAVLMNMETKEILIARAKTVIIATGGA